MKIPVTFFSAIFILAYLCSMGTDYQIPEPFLVNPLKHHLGYIKGYADLRIDCQSDDDVQDLIKDLKHLGTSVTDVYSGKLSVVDICREAKTFLEKRNIITRELFSLWSGTDSSDFRIITLSDESQWTVKYHPLGKRFIHIFPARCSQHTFRIRSNTLKTAILYYVIIGKDLVTVDDLNRIRPFMGLSPIKYSVDTRAVTEMIELIRR